MSKTMWLVRDEGWVVFDTKEWKDAIECPKSEYELEVTLSDAEAAHYEETRERWYAWQRKLAAMLDKE